MQVKLFTFRYSATLGGFDDTPLLEFTRDKELVAFREYFYSVNEVPHLCCVLTWQDAVVTDRQLQLAREGPAPDDPRARPAASSRSRRKKDPSTVLDESQRALFNTLRAWRKTTADAQGVPPYVVLTDRQLVELIQRRPDSKTALGHVHGIGPAKVERYGDALLKALGTAPAEAQEPAP